MSSINIAIIGLDSSHGVEFPRRIQAPDCPPAQMSDGLAVSGCLRMPSPFADEDVQNDRQEELEGWGINVTTDFDTAIAGCDAIMILINDPALHLEYFEKCLMLGKRIFMDKPLADNYAHARKIMSRVIVEDIPFFTASSLRFAPALKEACRAVKKPRMVSVYGALGTPPGGSALVWYGVHAFEMLQRIMGSGAERVHLRFDPMGAIATVDYDNRRRGTVELARGIWSYGGTIRNDRDAVPYCVEGSVLYRDQLREVKKFFAGGAPPVSVFDSLEVMALLEAAEESSKTGKAVDVIKVPRDGSPV